VVLLIYAKQMYALGNIEIGHNCNLPNPYLLTIHSFDSI